MKTKLFRMLLTFTALFLVLQPADAQFSKILKKAKKVLETTASNSSQQSQDKVPAGFATTKTTTASGAIIENPFSQTMDVQLVGAYGQSTSQNYGTAYIVLKVKMIANKSRLNFGGEQNFPGSSQNVRMTCIDQDGNTYITDANPGSNENFDVTEGVYVKIDLNKPNTRFVDVKKTAKVLQAVKLTLYVDAATRGHITLKNVPLQWDVQP